MTIRKVVVVCLAARILSRHRGRPLRPCPPPPREWPRRPAAPFPVRRPHHRRPTAAAAAIAAAAGLRRAEAIKRCPRRPALARHRPRATLLRDRSTGAGLLLPKRMPWLWLWPTLRRRCSRRIELPCALLSGGHLSARARYRPAARLLIMRVSRRTHAAAHLATPSSSASNGRRWPRAAPRLGGAATTLRASALSRPGESRVQPSERLHERLFLKIKLLQAHSAWCAGSSHHTPLPDATGWRTPTTGGAMVLSALIRVPRGAAAASPKRR